MKIRKDDNVLVISVKDKGKTGKVLKVLTKTGKIVVE
jgi:large subunit ribosomal protein L24